MRAQDVKNMTRKSGSEKIELQKSGSNIIDLRKIDGDGSFPCSKCGILISPEDETEEVYKIVHTKLVNDELVELDIECRGCKNKIKLTGFQTTIESLASKR